MRISDWSSDVCSSDLWAAERLSTHRFGDVIILPLRRNLDELASSAIRSEHLATPDRPFAFADLLESVASAAGCGGVVVDVRAGLVPLAAQLVLDPSIFRVVVSSRSEEHTSELQSLMRISYAVFCLKKKKTSNKT